jgi:tRNA1(Val) A37 N6-methylase TrmN6
MAAEPVATSEDAVLGGRLVLRQPLKGHRVGHDAILLAAASSAQARDRIVDLGAGVGAAGLALARRVTDLTVTLVEIDPVLVELARENAARNGFVAEKVHAVCLDVAASNAEFAAAALTAAAADHVLMNPPFNAGHNPSPDRARRLAHAAAQDLLVLWLRVAAWLLRPGGTVTLIWRADALDAMLAAVSADFGAIAVLPVHPKPCAPAIRVLVRAVKASGAPLSLLPGFFLNDAAGKPTAEAEAVLRGATRLPLAED